MRLANRLSLRQSIIIIPLIIILLTIAIFVLLLPSTKPGFYASHVSCEAPKSFSDLSYTDKNNNTLLFPDGGYIVPIFQNEVPLGLAIFGEGFLQTNELNLKVKESFVLLPEEEYYVLMSNLYLQTCNDYYFRTKTIDYLPTVFNNIPFILTPAGNKYFSLPVDCSSILISTGEVGFDNLMVIAGQNKNILLSNNIIYNTIAYILLYLALIGFIIVLTNKTFENYKPLRILLPSPGKFRWQLLFLNIVWLGLIVTAQNSWLIGVFLCFAIGYSIYNLIFKYNISAQSLRITPAKYWRSLPVVLLCGFIFFYLGYMNMPSYTQPSLTLIENLICNIWLPILWIFFMIFSYLQYELDRKITNSSSLYILAIVFTVLYFSYAYFTNINIYYALFNSIIFIPLIFIAVYTLILRSENVFTASTAIILSLTLANLLA